MASSAFYKKVNSQIALSFDQVQPLLEQLTAELSLSRPSDPIATMIERLKGMEAEIRERYHHENPPATFSDSALAADGAAAAASSKKKGGAMDQLSDKVEAPRKLISIFGPAYSGKTTQCSMALGSRGVILSPYELLNEAVNSGRQKNSHDTAIPSDLQLQVLHLMQRGIKAPTEVLTRLLVNRIEQVEAREEALRESVGRHALTPITFFLDGYPRTVEQALALEKALGDIHCAVMLFCPRKVCEERMTAAGVCKEDQEARWRLHEEYTIPLEEYWKAKKSLRLVDGTLDRNQTNLHVKSFIIDTEV